MKRSVFVFCDCVATALRISCESVATASRKEAFSHFAITLPRNDAFSKNNKFSFFYDVKKNPYKRKRFFEK